MGDLSGSLGHWDLLLYMGSCTIGFEVGGISLFLKLFYIAVELISNVLISGFRGQKPGGGFGR